MNSHLLIAVAPAGAALLTLIVRAGWRAWRTNIMPAPTQKELDQQAAAKTAADAIKQQIADQTAQIASLKSQLSDANAKTNDLAQQITVLQTAAGNDALDGGWAEVVSELQAIAAPPPVTVDPSTPAVAPTDPTAPPPAS